MYVFNLKMDICSLKIELSSWSSWFFQPAFRVFFSAIEIFPCSFVYLVHVIYVPVNDDSPPFDVCAGAGWRTICVLFIRHEPYLWYAH